MKSAERTKRYRIRRAEDHKCDCCGAPIVETLARESQRFCSSACAGRKKSGHEIYNRGQTIKRTGPLREFWQVNDGYEFESNKEYQRARRLWLKFRLPWSSYLELFKKGRGACWICGRVTDVLAVDHDHETGRTRGLLCVPCNVALGKFEQTEWREAALHYLETLSVACVTG